MLAAASNTPAIGWALPFVAFLLCIAIFPLFPRAAHWWEQNSNKLLLGLVLGAVVLGYSYQRGFGAPLHHPIVEKLFNAAGWHIDSTDSHAVSAPGLPALIATLGNATMEYLPFMALLFSLYTISGGIAVRGDIPAHPSTNTLLLALGGVIANLIGTTGASMLLIRPLLNTNSERRRVKHTVIFFIFIVSNVGGCLLPIGDPPLFLGFLRGVPFTWTLDLWREWAFMLGALLIIYYVWDTREYKAEDPSALAKDETQKQRIRVLGLSNVIWLAAVMAAVAIFDPNRTIPGTSITPPPFMREGILLVLVLISWRTTPAGLRHAAGFNFIAIAEVAALFVGIFITMQVPIEILNARGGELGLTKPWHFFWATGALSSFLDNAPTYVVFFETANSMTHAAGDGIFPLLSGEFIRQDLLVAISLGAVFMGANTYIGNGPNFMVKSIAEQSGVKMPSFFGYMAYSCAVLLPLFLLVSWIFM